MALKAAPFSAFWRRPSEQRHVPVLVVLKELLDRFLNDPGQG
jgi:hypothetical protein